LALDDYVKKFDTFDIDEKKFEDIKQRVVGVNKKFDKIIIDYNNALIGIMNIHFFLMKYQLEMFLDAF